MEFPEYYDLPGTFTDESGAESAFQMRIPQTVYSHFYMQMMVNGDAISFEGRHLNHTRGNISGHTTGADSVKHPFIMTRK
ncbi:hypothetical protein [Mangrovivirga cuniculi]|uniref:Uncharacterized protein n=1 Tax=Mangrovivirga cuniculi TaxID=2715131 RepID=A0A4D7JLJ5_9BACT|nr:hypothetical protein [Mangrovivirga cuniculi]QCK15763.1 hypothetical protein DCC35_13925 [Mangrovivirga cuniculi]